MEGPIIGIQLIGALFGRVWFKRKTTVSCVFFCKFLLIIFRCMSHDHLYTVLLQTRIETKRFPILQATGPTRLKPKQEDFAKVKGHRSGSEMVKGSRIVRTSIQLSSPLTRKT